MVLLYDHTSPDTAVNSAQKIIFAHKGRELDKIPSTGNAPVLHTKGLLCERHIVVATVKNFLLTYHLNIGVGLNRTLVLENGLLSRQSSPTRRVLIRAAKMWLYQRFLQELLL